MHSNRSFQSGIASAQATRMGRSTWEKFTRRTWFGCLALLTVMMLALTAEDARAQSANDGFDPGANGSVLALAVSGSDLYVGGAFTQTSDGVVTNLYHIAKFSGGVWSALPNSGLNGVNVSALAVSGSDCLDEGSAPPRRWMWTDA